MKTTISTCFAVVQIYLASQVAAVPLKDTPLMTEDLAQVETEGWSDLGKHLKTAGKFAGKVAKHAVENPEITMALTNALLPADAAAKTTTAFQTAQQAHQIYKAVTD